MASAVLSTTRNYLDLTKPRLLPLVLFSGLPVLGMAADGWPSVAFMAWTMVGIALAAAAANTLNAYLEADKDALMERTQERPLPAGLLAPEAALRFGVALSIFSTGLLWWVSGPAAAGIALASILFYVFAYTLWAKPRSASNVFVGGVAGAVSPLIADAAVDGSVGAPGLALFALVFFWQPPHVWAIALYRKADYEAAGIPMAPSVIGDRATRWAILVCSLVLVPVALAPWWLELVGPLYLVVALAASVGFVGYAVQLLRLANHDAARAMFRFSLAYLFALFGAMIIDVVLL